jgi:3-oxoacyl-[acyl-carrier protein] reductase
MMDIAKQAFAAPVAHDSTQEGNEMTELNFDFSGRTAVVTGAGRGIGRAIADRFTRAGAFVVAVDIDPDVIKETAGEIGAFPASADVSETEDVERVIATAVEQTGRVDILVNNAGILRDGMLWKLTDEDWDAVLRVHLGGSFRFTRACTPHFRKQQYGRVINVTSISGLRGNIGQAAYSAAKAGIVGLTLTSARELARFGVTVNAISPSARTRMVDSIPAERLEEIEKTIPIGRLGEPSEMADAVAFFAAEESRFITGMVLSVDGGQGM